VWLAKIVEKNQNSHGVAFNAGVEIVVDRDRNIIFIVPRGDLGGRSDDGSRSLHDDDEIM
jgi:hypothetical protein